jgi:putative tricarboxylic transport membrane protein
MNKGAEAGEAGPSHRAVEAGVAIGMAVFGLIVIAGSLQVGIGWGAEGPRSGFFPFYVGLTIVIASAVNLVQALGYDRNRLFAEWGQLRQVFSVVVPTAIYVVSVPWIGIYLSSIALISVFMIWLGRYRVAVAAGIAVAAMLATYLIFEKWFMVPLPKGPIEDYFGL